MQRQSYFQFEFKDIVWKNVIIFLYLHGAAIYGIYLLAIREAKFMTFVLGMILKNEKNKILKLRRVCKKKFNRVVSSHHRRLHVWHNWRVWHNRRCASTMGTQIVQGHMAVETHFGRRQFDCISKLHP